MVNVNRPTLEADIKTLEHDLTGGGKNWVVAHRACLRRVLAIVKEDYGIQERMDLGEHG